LAGPRSIPRVTRREARSLAAHVWCGWIVLATLLSTGCRTYTTQSREMTGTWAAGDAAGAARAFGERAEKKAGSKDAVIWHLEAGASFRAAGDFAKSNQHLQAAADRMDAYERKAKVRLGNEAGALFSNQQNLPYEGRGYDKIMVHTYRALNYLALQDREKARPELIRAYQRQQDAVTANQRRIEEAAAAEKSSGQSAAMDKTRADPGFSRTVGELTRGLEGFKAYADYVNPFTVYLDGLYFLHAGSGASDFERASKSFRRVIEVAGSNPAVEADAQLTEAIAAGRTPPGQALTYVIFETGRAASREQVRIDIPIILADVSYVGAAFPKLVFHDGHATPLTIQGGGTQIATSLLSSMDSVVALDFRNEFPTILTKTLISTVAKAAAGYAVNDAARRQDEGLGLLVRIATAALQAAVNIADTRSWTTLPKEFQVARLNTPSDRRVTLTVPGQAPVQVALIDGRVNVVYVRSVRAGGSLMLSQFILK
jgi:hypothetical protein